MATKEYKINTCPLDQIIMRAIYEWIEEHDKRVVFHGGFIAFDEDGDMVESRMICYGHKPILQTSIEAFLEEFNKEEEGFVNW